MRPDADPLLIPPPASIERHPGVTTATEPAAAIDRDAAPGAYRLRITPSAVRIDHRDDAGLRHAQATLAQLRNQYGDAVPCLTINDAPTIARRGFMLDVSRDRIPLQSELLRLPAQLAALKLDHLQLYTEHTFAYPGHESLSGGWSPITPAELAHLDRTAADHGVELAANQNCFGHLAEWFRNPRYAPLAEIQPEHDPWTIFGTHRRGGFSLCPTDPRSIELTSEWLRTLAPIVRSSLINIGCDETGDVGQGRSRAQVDNSSLQQVWLEFVRKLCESCARLGKTPMLWADVPQDHPDVLRALPDQAIPIIWNYEAENDFDRHAQTVAESGRRFWLSPGTSCWRSFTGRTTERRANLRSCAQAAKAHGAEGLLITAWGDLGHRQQWPVTLHALADAASCAWTGGRNADPDAISLQVFNDRSLRTGAWLEELGEADAELRADCGYQSGSRLLNATALFEEVSPAKPRDDKPGSADRWREVRARLTDLAARVPTGAGPLVTDELRHTADRALLCADWAVHRRARPGDSAPDLAERLVDIIRDHRRLWKIRSRVGGLDRSCAHDEAARARMLTGETG